MGQSLSQRLAKSAALRVISSKPFSLQLPQQNVRNIFLSIFVNNNFLKALAIHWAHMYWVLWGHLRLWAEGDYIFGWGTVDGGRMSWCLAVSVNPCFIGFKTATVLWTALRKKIVKFHFKSEWLFRIREETAKAINLRKLRNVTDITKFGKK